MKGFTSMLAAAILGVSLGTAPAADPAPESGYLQARKLLQNGIIFEAIHKLEDHLQAHGTDTEARMTLARALVQVDRPGQAAEALGMVLHREPKHPEASLMLSRLLLRLDRELPVDAPQAMLALARLSARTGHIDRATDLYLRCLALQQAAPIQLEFARQLSWANRIPEAAARYRRYLASVPGDVEALSELGRLYNTLGQFDRAAECFRACLEKEPGDYEHRLNLARALAWGGRDQEAEPLFRALVEEFPGREEPYFLLGALLRARGEGGDDPAAYAKAMASFAPSVASGTLTPEQIADREIARLQHEIAAAPTPADAVKLGEALVEQLRKAGRVGEALHELDRMLALQPDHAEARALSKRLRAEMTVRVRERVEALRKDRLAALPGRGLPAFQQWVERNPDDALTRWRYAAVAWQVGQADAAGQQWAALALGDPGNPRIVEQQAALGSPGAPPETGKASP